MKSKRNSLFIVLGIFIGIVAGLVISTNFDWTKSVTAAKPQPPVMIGSSEPVAEELKGLESLSKAFATVAKEVNSAVVTINSETVVKRRFSHPFFDDPFFKRFFNVPEEEEEQIMRGLGSGVIVNPEGYIITNNHVIDEADEITVTIDKKEYKAEIVGKDPLSDLAVIKIDKDDLSAVRIGNSDDLEVGEWVLAIGNPFSSVLQNTVTAGIVSAKGRSRLPIGGSNTGIQYQDFIQTDAAINPGNSGGALVNLRGELVGINTAIIGQANVGIGFAIPINTAKNVMDQLINKGRVVRGWLGVQIQRVDEELAESYDLKDVTGVLIASVTDNSPAEKAGVEPGDIVLKVNDEKMETLEQLQNTIASYPPDEKVELSVWRDGKRKTLTVKLGERPGQEELASSRGGEKPTSMSTELGFEVQALTDDLARRLGYEDDEGVLVSDVKRNSVADREGIREGDLITSVNRRPIKSIRDFNQEMDKLKEDDIVLFRIKREDVNLFAALRVPKN